MQKMWLPLVLKLLRRRRWQTKQDVWKSWLIIRLSRKLDAQRKLRDLLWRAWTTPQCGSSSASRDLSLRDQFVRVRFSDECGQMRMQLARAIQAQQDILMTCPDFSRALPARGAAEAGITTPTSARKASKKARGRGGRGMQPGAVESRNPAT